MGVGVRSFRVKIEQVLAAWRGPGTARRASPEGLGRLAASGRLALKDFFQDNAWRRSPPSTQDPGFPTIWGEWGRNSSQALSEPGGQRCGPMGVTGLQCATRRGYCPTCEIRIVHIWICWECASTTALSRAYRTLELSQAGIDVGSPARHLR